MALIKEYFELTKKHQEECGENTIVLMQVGAFLEIYGLKDKENNITGSKIVEFSQACGLRITDKKVCVGNYNVVMAGFQEPQLETNLKKTQDSGFTIVVYEQDENVKNATRSLVNIFSPGTYFQSDTKQLTNSICCIWINYYEGKLLVKGKNVVCGVANVDIYNGKSTIMQFKEKYINSPTTFDELERFISCYNPSETIIIHNLPHENDVENVISYAGISSSIIHRIYINSVTLANEKKKRINNCEKQTYQKEILSKYYTESNIDIFLQDFDQNIIATQAFCYLLDFLYQYNSRLVSKIAKPIFENSQTRLALSNHSLRQLNMINDGHVKESKKSCVSSLLNYCSTSMGKRMFEQTILNPICDETILTREYNIIEYLLDNFDQNSVANFRNKLSNIKDLSNVERQIILKKISPKSLCFLNSSLKIISNIFELVKNNKTIMSYLGSEIDEVGELCEEISEFITHNINIDLAFDIEQIRDIDTNFINREIDAEVDAKCDLLSDSENGLEAIRVHLSNLIETKDKQAKSNTEYVKLHTTEKSGIGLIATSRRCNLLKETLPSKEEERMLNIGKNKSFIFKVSKTQFTFERQSGSNNYICDPQIDSFCRNITSIRGVLRDLITKAYNIIIDKLGLFQTKLERIINFVTSLDMIFTKSYIAREFKYCKPEIVSSSKKSFVDLVGLRHCLIERFQTDEIYVTNDISIGNGITDGVLLYGTNAVGKTTFIRALGIAVIMAQAGLYVPCSEFRFKPYRRIFTRIVGNDNIFKGLSTFEVEMSELRTILTFMDDSSLILGDELCSGTETTSAISIFVAGVQHLHKCECSFIFATHLHEIVDYEEITGLSRLSLKHMEVKYDAVTDTLIYDRKLREGSGYKLYGLEVCKALSLPKDFLDYANQIRIKYNPDSQSILSLKESRYNSNVIVGSCSNCGLNVGKEVHHLQHQANADEDGFIKNEVGVFHKNHKANLEVLCDKCHDKIHNKKVQHKKVKTTKGSKLIETP